MKIKKYWFTLIFNNFLFFLEVYKTSYILIKKTPKFFKSHIRVNFFRSSKVKKTDCSCFFPNAPLHWSDDLKTAIFIIQSVNVKPLYSRIFYPIHWCLLIFSFRFLFRFFKSSKNLLLFTFWLPLGQKWKEKDKKNNFLPVNTMFQHFK